MRCQYTFKLHGQIKPKEIIAFEVDDFRFEFVLENTLIDSIVVSFPIGSDDVPKIDESKTEGVKFDIKFVYPRWNELEVIIRQIEGMWSIWGLESIDISSNTIKWIPESEEEKEQIKIYKFQMDKIKFKPEDIEPVGFNLLARPIISAVRDKNHDVVLSFFRRGSNAIKKAEYIEAFYDFYFMIESHYGNGKTRNSAIEKELISSKYLEGYINKLLKNNKYIYSLPTELREKFKIEYSLTSQEFIKKIVKLRGFLHHHNTKRNNGWDPDKQTTYKLEAFLLQDICLNVSMEILDKTIFTDRIVNEYKKMFGK